MSRAVARRFGSIQTDEDKAYYCLGVNVAQQLQDLKSCSHAEIDCVLGGMRDSLTSAEPRVDIDKWMPKAAEVMQAKQKAAREAANKAQVEFLTTAAKEPGATQTESGLVIVSVQAGVGKSPVKSDSVEVHYEGKLIDGTVFDSSIQRGETICFPLSGVIKGWTEGLQLMKEGGKAKLTIPSELGYGARGSPPKIPPGATLVFDVELIAVK